MIKPDMIVVSPNNLDFPVWRELVKNNRQYFGKVMNAIHPAHRSEDYTAFVKANSPGIQVMDSPSMVPCWRHNATNLMLSKCTSDWVLFFEQDFLPLTDNFFPTILNAAKPNTVIGFNYAKEFSKGNRLHPACILMERSVVNRTTKDFTPGGRDCFNAFSDELLDLNVDYVPLEDLGLEEHKNWFHWNGLCSNISLVQEGKKPNHQIQKFKEYIQLSLNAQVAHDPKFTSLLHKCLGA